MNTADNLALQADPWFWIVTFTLYVIIVALMTVVIKKQYGPPKARLWIFVLVMLAGFAAFYVAGTFFNIDILQ